MKIKHKMIGMYMISIFLSVTIFLLFCYYILNIGYYSGVSSLDMKAAVADGAEYLWSLDDFQEEAESTSQPETQERNQSAPQEQNQAHLEDQIRNQELTLVTSLDEKYVNMKFAVWGSEGFVAEPEEDLPVIASETNLLDGINRTWENSSDYYMAAVGKTGVGSSGEEQTRYLVCYVNRADFEAMSYSFNFSRERGLLGKLAVVGAIITTLIMGAFLFIFSRRMIRRFDNMYNTMEQFSANKLDARMVLGGNDELTVMAGTFNSMADKIEKQYRDKVTEEENRKALVSNISHDLRTPLSSVIGYSEMLENEIYEDENEQKKYHRIIHQKAIYMEKLLSELLEYSRLELGTINLHLEQVDLAENLREILTEYYKELERENCELSLEIPEIPVVGIWDGERLERVIRNLLDNALKYGMSGKKLDIILTENETEEIHLIIRDYGKGIPEELVSLVTERFYRADSARNSAVGGMGLGLYIAEETIRLHGGRLILENAQGGGLHTEIILPQNLMEN